MLKFLSRVRTREKTSTNYFDLISSMASVSYRQTPDIDHNCSKEYYPNIQFHYTQRIRTKIKLLPEHLRVHGYLKYLNRMLSARAREQLHLDTLQSRNVLIPVNAPAEEDFTSAIGKRIHVSKSLSFWVRLP